MSRQRGFCRTFFLNHVPFCHFSSGNLNFTICVFYPAECEYYFLGDLAVVMKLPPTTSANIPVQLLVMVEFPPPSPIFKKKFLNVFFLLFFFYIYIFMSSVCLLWIFFFFTSKLLDQSG